MNTDKRSLIVIASVAVLLAALLFGLDAHTSSSAQTTIIMLTVTPPAQMYQPGTLANLGNNIDKALPNFADFVKTSGQAAVQAAPVAQAQAAPAEPVAQVASGVTGWLDPTLGKVLIVDGVNKKLRCDGLESNQDFAGLNESQKMLAKDTCSHL